MLAGLVFVAFWPSLSGQWLKWDDDRNFLDHEAWRGLSPAHLSWMFTTFHQGPYQPLSWLTLAIDHALWGMDPFGYHLTNVVLHAATAVVFFFLARRAIGLVLRRSRSAAEAHDATVASWDCARVVDAAAFFATALFALHPLRVESVAWITERRDVLSGLFLMPCVTLYLRAHTADGSSRADSRRWIAWSLALYAASLLSKGLGMTLPVVLLVLDVFVLARWKGILGRDAGERHPRVSLASLVAEKWAYWLLAAIAAALAWHGQKHHASIVSWSDHTARERLAQSFFGLEYYASKTVWPTNLSPLVVLPKDVDPFAPRFLVPILVVPAVATFAWFVRRRVPALLGSLLAYAVFASPVLGWTQAGPQLVADRYSYLPGTALALSGGGALAWMLSRWPARFPLVASLALVPVLAWTTAARAQCRVWHDTVSIWERASRVSPESTDAWRNLTVAIQHAAEQSTDPAHKIEWYERGLRECVDGLALQPDAGLASNAVGMEIALAELRPEASAALTSSAYAHVLEALRLGAEANQPLPVAYENHAILAIRMGHAEEAVPSLEWLCAHDPDDANYALMLGQTLVMLGRFSDALAPLDRAQKLDPRTPVSWMEAGTAFKSLGRNADARRCYERGIAIARSLPPESGVTSDLLAEWTRLLSELPP